MPRRRRPGDGDLRHRLPRTGASSCATCCAPATPARDRESFPQIDADGAIAAVARVRPPDARRRLLSPRFLDRQPPARRRALRRSDVADVAVLDLNRCRSERRRERAGSHARSLPSAARPRGRPGESARRLLRARGGAGSRRAGATSSRVGASSRRIRWQGRLRGALARAQSWLVPRGTHAHIPPPPEEAPIARPGGLGPALRPAPPARRAPRPGAHPARRPAATTCGRPPPSPARCRASARRYRELAGERRRTAAPFAWPERRASPCAPGRRIRRRCWRPSTARRTAGRCSVCTPGRRRHDDEQALARALAARGVELAFALPQNRDLVRDPARWRASIDELGRALRAVRAGASRSARRSTAASGGSGTTSEYLELAARAAGDPARGPAARASRSSGRR